MNVAGRLALLSIAIAAYAGLALASGADRRSSQAQPAIAFLPEPMKAAAWRVETARALAEQDQAAVAQAREAVSADPNHPQASALLAVSLAAAREPALSHAAFSASDELSKRNALVQAYFFDRAMAAGDVQEAAMRVDRLLRATPTLARSEYFFARLEASEAGRAELARRLGARSGWAETYLTAFGNGDDVLRARAWFLSSEQAHDAVGCSDVGPMMGELMRRKYRADADRLAAARCPADESSGIIADAGFDRLGDADIFGWQRHSSGDVRVSARDEGGAEIANRSGTTRLALSQPVSLDAGEYRLTTRSTGGGTSRILGSFGCSAPARPRRLSDTLAEGQSLIAPACETLVLGLWVRPGEGLVGIDNVQLEAIR